MVYTLTDDLANPAITRLGRQQKALMPDKPFFMYLSGALMPHHVPQRMVGTAQASSHGWWTNFAKRCTCARKSWASFHRTQCSRCVMMTRREHCVLWNDAQLFLGAL